MRTVSFCAAVAAALATSACDLPMAVDAAGPPRMAVVAKETKVPFAWYASRCIGGEFVLVEGFYSYTITSDSVRVGVNGKYGYHFVAHGVATDVTTGVTYNYGETQSILTKNWPDTTAHALATVVHSRLVARGSEPDLHVTYLFHVVFDRSGEPRAYFEKAREDCTGT